MSGFGIKRRNNLLTTSAEEAIDERVLIAEDKCRSNDTFLPKLSKLPPEISSPLTSFKLSYYYKKYKIKVEKDFTDSYEVALQNLGKNKIDKSAKYFKLALEHKEIQRRTGTNVVCQLLELKILLGIEPEQSDLLDLKRAIGEKDERASWLLDLIGLQQHGNTYKFIRLDEAKEILLDDLKKDTVKFCSKTDADFTEFVKGHHTMEMAKLYSDESKKRIAYYLIKYSAMCCYNLEAIEVLMKLKPEKEDYYKNLFEKSKKIFSTDHVARDLQTESQDPPCGAIR